MLYRKLGNSELGNSLELSAIVFGAWAAGGWMWGGTERKEARQAIVESYHAGVTSIDTAPIYGQGLSEEIVGEAIKDLPRDKVQILTKFGMRWDISKGEFAMSSKDNSGKPIDIYKYAGKNSVIRECEDSLRRLGTDYIDLYQIHWPDASTPISETMEALSILIDQGKVRFAGVCNYTSEMMEEADLYLDLVSNQVPYSIVRRDIEEDVVPSCIQNGKGVLAYSPLERGLLTGKIKTGHSFARGDHRVKLSYFQVGNLERVNAFLARIEWLAQEKNASIAQLVLRWTVDQPGITAALVGARNAEQALQNAAATDVYLTPIEIDFITWELEELKMSQ